MKLYIKSILIIGMITIIGVGGYFAWHQLHAPKQATAKANNPTVDELLAQSVDTNDITTNFADGGFIKAKFKIIASSKQEAADIKKLQFKAESTIIQYINGMKKDDANGLSGFNSLEMNLTKELNKQLGKNAVSRVYMEDKLIQ